MDFPVFPDLWISNTASQVAKAIMQYRNTPLLDLSLSPAQILFHLNIKDYIPTHPSHHELYKEWVIFAQQREHCLSQRNIKLCECHNTTSHELQEVPVAIRNQGGVVLTHIILYLCFMFCLV